MFKKRNCTAACVIVALLSQTAFAPIALADGFTAEPDKNPRLMFYVSKAFGEKDALRSAPKLGLRMERAIQFNSLKSTRSLHSTHLMSSDPLSLEHMAIFDLRWTKGFGKSVYVANLPLYRSPLQLNSTEGSSSEESASGESASLESVGPGGKILIISAAALAILCATNTVICEKDDDGNYTIPNDDTPTTDG